MWLALTGSRFHLVGLFEQPCTSSTPCATVFAVPPVVLDVEGVELRASVDRLPAPTKPEDLVRLAAEPDDQDRREVRVLRITAERRAQHCTGCRRCRRAAGAVRQRDHAVDVRILSRALREWMSRRKRSAIARATGRRAVHRGQDADVMRVAMPPIGAPNAHEVAGVVDELRRVHASVGA